MNTALVMLAVASIALLILSFILSPNEVLNQAERIVKFKQTKDDL